MFFIYIQAKTIRKINFWQAWCSFSFVDLLKRQERAIQSFSKSCSDRSFISAARNWDVLYILLSQRWSPYRNIFQGCLIRTDYQRMRDVVLSNFLYYLMHKNQFNVFAGFVRYWYFSGCCHPSNKSHSKRHWAHEVLILIRFKLGSELLWISTLAAAIAIVLFITFPLWQSAIKKSRIFLSAVPSINGLPLHFAGIPLTGDVEFFFPRLLMAVYFFKNNLTVLSFRLG